MEPPFPDEASELSHKPRVNPGSNEREDDFLPTGEHRSTTLNLSGADLEPDDGMEPEDDSTPESQLEKHPTLDAAPRKTPAAQLHSSPDARTSPPQLRALRDRPPPDLDDEDLFEGNQDPLETAPTRIEHEDDIRATVEGSFVQGPRLLIIGGNNRGVEFKLKLGDNSMGRGTDNDIVLGDIAISRKHALICFEGNRFVLRDLGSGNGTLVNGKQADSQELQDGDQVELGNTLMRFLNPVVPVPLAQMQTLISPRALAASESLPTENIPRNIAAAAAASAKQAKRRGLGALDPRVKRYALFAGIGLVALVSLIFVFKALFTSKKGAAPQSVAHGTIKTDEVVIQELRDGIKEYNAHNWELARSHFLKVLALSPQQADIRRYVDNADSEIKARDTLELARKHLGAKNYLKANHAINAVSSGSVYQSEARTLKQKIEEEELKQLLKAAKALQASGDLIGALEKVRRAQKLAPTDATVKDIYAELTSTSKLATQEHKPKQQEPKHAKTPPRRHPTKVDRPPKVEKTKPPSVPEGDTIKVAGGKAKEAITLYKERQWGAAYKAATDFLSTQKGKKQKAAKSLADAIRLVGQNWTRAEQTSSPEQSMKYLEEALKNDLKIEKGPHQKALKEKVLKIARAQASTALQRGKNAEAYSAVKLAEKYGRSDPSLQKVLSTLEKRAQEMLDRANAMRSNNVAGARRLWQEIIRMLPPSNPVYQKAYNALNSAGPTYHDEDEE
jgi:tetratricopeptide (TPR) repeat protein